MQDDTLTRRVYFDQAASNALKIKVYFLKLRAFCKIFTASSDLFMLPFQSTTPEYALKYLSKGRN